MDNVRVAPGIFPPSISTTPNSPTVWVNASTALVSTERRAIGSTTETNTFHGLAPSPAAASTSPLSTAENPATRGCTAKGKLYSTEPTSNPVKLNASG